MEPTDFTIVSAPVKINLYCPYCDSNISIPWKDVDAPEYWGDRWPDVKCPDCGREIQLGEYEYD